MSKIIVNLFGGGYYAEQKGGQALIHYACSPRLPKGGQRHSVEVRKLIEIGGDSYGK